MRKNSGLLEDGVFGVCSSIADKLGVSSGSVRTFFIYSSFIAVGSPVVIYLGLAYLMNMKRHLRRRNSVWDF